MAQGVLLRRLHLGERPAGPLRDKQRIVTEPARTPLDRRDHAFDRAVENTRPLPRFGQRQHAPKAPAPILAAHLAQFFEQQRTVGRHVRPLAGEPRRPHPRRAAQRINLES